MWNLFHNVIDLGVTPQSVLRTASSPKGEPDKKSLPFRGGEPAKLVEGFFCGIFYMM